MDDYTQLASIYIVDACLRHNMIPEALEVSSSWFGSGFGRWTMH